MATRIETAYTRRAQYYSSADGFNIKRPAVPAHVVDAGRSMPEVLSEVKALVWSQL